MGKFDTQGALRSLLREVEFKELALLEDRGSVGEMVGGMRNYLHLDQLRAYFTCGRREIANLSEPNSVGQFSSTWA